MIGLAFFLEDLNKNIYSGSDNSFELWRTTAKSLDCSHFFMIDTTTNKIGKNFKNIDEEITYEYFESLEEFLQNKKNIIIIGLETEATCRQITESYTNIYDFNHPQDNVIYLTGTDSQGFTKNYDEISNWVTIPNVTYSFWSIIAASIVLHDRKRKQWLQQ